MDITAQLRRICLHDSRSVPGCLTCEAADTIESMRGELSTLRSQNAELTAENERLKTQSESLARSVMSDHVSNDSHSLFIAAIRDLAAINEHLDLDPYDGGAVPIIGAIDELRAALVSARDSFDLVIDASISPKACHLAQSAREQIDAALQGKEGE